MNFTYDPSANALYLSLKKTSIVKTVEYDGFVLDYDEAGIAGIEILEANTFLSSQKTFPTSIPIEKVTV